MYHQGQGITATVTSSYGREYGSVPQQQATCPSVFPLLTVNEERTTAAETQPFPTLSNVTNFAPGCTTGHAGARSAAPLRHQLRGLRCHPKVSRRGPARRRQAPAAPLPHRPKKRRPTRWRPLTVPRDPTPACCAPAPHGMHVVSASALVRGGLRATPAPLPVRLDHGCVRCPRRRHGCDRARHPGIPPSAHGIHARNGPACAGRSHPGLCHRLLHGGAQHGRVLGLGRALRPRPVSASTSPRPHGSPGRYTSGGLGVGFLRAPLAGEAVQRFEDPRPTRRAPAASVHCWAAACRRLSSPRG